jgi:hypothetical protein
MSHGITGPSARSRRLGRWAANLKTPTTTASWHRTDERRDHSTRAGRARRRLGRRRPGPDRNAAWQHGLRPTLGLGPVRFARSGGWMAPTMKTHWRDRRSGCREGNPSRTKLCQSESVTVAVVAWLRVLFGCGAGRGARAHAPGAAATPLPLPAAWPATSDARSARGPRPRSAAVCSARRRRRRQAWRFTSRASCAGHSGSSGAKNDRASQLVEHSRAPCAGHSGCNAHVAKNDRATTSTETIVGPRRVQTLSHLVIGMVAVVKG